MSLLEKLFSFNESRVDDGQLPSSIGRIIDSETAFFNSSVSVTVRNSIPSTSEIPIQNPTHWLKIPNVIACFVDMEGSTKLSATLHQNTTAKSYRYFTQTAVNIFSAFNASYIDVKGDGVFALFDESYPYTALAATISFKTFVSDYFTPKVEKQTSLKVGGHFGIDQKTVLVRKLGLKRIDDRTDRQNEVWAGKPINMAAKLASTSTNNRLWVSDRFFRNLKHDKALKSCGCPMGEPVDLWQSEDLSQDDRFDFDTAFSLGSNWCRKHGKHFCAELVRLDDPK